MCIIWQKTHKGHRINSAFDPPPSTVYTPPPKPDPFPHLVVDLRGEFPGRGEDEAGGRLKGGARGAAQSALDDLGEDGEEEGGGFPASGLGASHQIASRVQDRHRVLLDRRRLGKRRRRESFRERGLGREPKNVKITREKERRSDGYYMRLVADDEGEVG